MNEDKIKLTVVIVNYNVKYLLEQCLYSVRAASDGMNIEVIVVDNNSSDGSIEYLRSRFPEVRYIENKTNPGFSKANNQAILQSRSEYVLLLNPDTVVGENTFRTLCLFMDEHIEAGALGVKMIDANGRFLPESKRSLPTPWVSFCKLSGLSKLFPSSGRFASYSLPYLDSDSIHKVDILAGAFMFIRKEALDRVGLLDETFFMYGEDIDLSYRIVLGGYVNYYYPERILHYKGESTRQNDIKYIQAFYNAMLIFYRKHFSGSGLMAAFVRLAVKMRIKTASVFGHKNKKALRAMTPRYLVFCASEHLDGMKEKVSQTNVDWNFVDKDDFPESINNKNRYTDIVFHFPDTSFEKMLLFMDKMPDKTIRYHIYNNYTGRLITASK